MGLAATKGYAGGEATVNGPSERAELTGLAQPLWTRPLLRLHGFMLPNTQMDGGAEGRGGEKRRESVGKRCWVEKKGGVTQGGRRCEGLMLRLGKRRARQK